MIDMPALLVVLISTLFGQSSIETYLRIPSEPQVGKIGVSLQPNRVAATPSVSATQYIDTEESDHNPSVMSRLEQRVANVQQRDFASAEIPKLIT